MRYLFLIIVVYLFSACKKCKTDDSNPELNYLSVKLQPFFGIDSLYLDSSYITSEGYRVKFTDIKCFFTDVNNNNNLLSDAVLYDFRETGNLLLEQEGVIEDFTNLRFVIGVDSLLNHSDPSAFPNDSPLNISNAGTMHWGWNPGYIFISIEGKVDTLATSSSTFDKNFSFHVGRDAFIGEKNFTNVNWQSINSNEHSLNLKLDMQLFLNGSTNSINLSNEFITHSSAGQDVLTNKVKENFIDAISQ